MIVKVKRLCPNINTIPKYASTGAGCFDFVATETKTIYPKSQEVFKCGVAFEIPEGMVMLMYGRSGLGFKHGLSLTNCVGVIDSDYRGEVHCALYNHFTTPFTICAGDRIAQGMIIPVPHVNFETVAELSTTERGQNGFGSTGISS